MAKTPKIKDYNAQSRDVYEQNRVHTGKREMLTPGTRIALTIAAVVIFAIIGYLVVVVGFRMVAQFASEFGAKVDAGQSFADVDVRFNIGWPTSKEWIAIGIWTLVWGLMFANYFKRNLEAQNALNDKSDINEYEDDQYLATPEEVMQTYALFPDIGGHADIQVSSLISHIMIDNKGIKKIKIANRAKSDIVDEDGEIVYRKGEALEDDDGNIITSDVPMFDTNYAKKVYETSFVAPEYQKAYDVRKMPYNPGKKTFGKLPYETAADLINGVWTFPEYEVQRPTGAYLVDTDPVNTMVLASTRAGKGQTYIEPTIDMWTREERKNNIVINDPKGELTVKFYEPATVRGYDVIQFNLINAMKTDIYNPLALAANSAREGDFTKCSAYTENIADVFFPVDGAEDPVWPNAANNAFKRAVYGMIDFYMEVEAAMREEAVNNPDISLSGLETKIDQLWGHVTLYNCYQMFVRLSSKKVINPVAEVKAMQKEAAAAVGSGETPKYTPEEMQAKIISANRKGVLWNNAPDIDALTLYFNATAQLPSNGIRSICTNAHNSLLAMGGADKMIASYDSLCA